MLATMKDVSSHILMNQKIKGALNSTLAEKLVPESTIAQDLRKQRARGKALTGNTMQYFCEAMKLSREQRLKRANLEIKFGNW